MGGGISVGNNVMIGANVVIAAGAIVSHDIPDNTVAGGIPAKPIGSFDALVEKRRVVEVGFRDGTENIWAAFEAKRK